MQDSEWCSFSEEVPWIFLRVVVFCFGLRFLSAIPELLWFVVNSYIWIRSEKREILDLWSNLIHGLLIWSWSAKIGSRSGSDPFSIWSRPTFWLSAFILWSSGIKCRLFWIVLLCNINKLSCHKARMKRGWCLKDGRQRLQTKKAWNRIFANFELIKKFIYQSPPPSLQRKNLNFIL